MLHSYMLVNIFNQLLLIYDLANNFENADVIVATEKEIVVSAVREGFQKVFGKSVVR